MTAGSSGRPGATLSLAALFAALLMLALAGLAAAPMPPAYAVSLAAFPLGGLVAGAVLARRGAQALLGLWSARLLAGLAAGLAATLAYDLYRVGVRQLLGISFDPFRVQPVFGQIITGLPTTHPAALAAGWGYHLWLGLLLGMIFAALRPRGGALWGAGFAALLQLGRWAMYPAVLVAGTSDKEFFANGVVGQLVWGAVLGLVVALIARRSQKSSR
jgi:hypothetical protein